MSARKASAPPPHTPCSRPRELQSKHGMPDTFMRNPPLERAPPPGNAAQALSCRKQCTSAGAALHFLIMSAAARTKASPYSAAKLELRRSPMADNASARSVRNFSHNVCSSTLRDVSLHAALVVAHAALQHLLTLRRRVGRSKTRDEQRLICVCVCLKHVAQMSACAFSLPIS